MNDFPEVFKKQSLEETIKILSSPKFYEVKNEVSKNLSFFRKFPKGKVISTLGLDKHNMEIKYGISIDIENNLIVLTDKFKENRHLVFVELSHTGQSSFNLYQSLIKSMSPGLILIESEPFQTPDGKVETIEDFSFYKSLLTNQYPDLEIKNNTVIHSQTKSLYEVESIILSSLPVTSIKTNKVRISLFDLPFHNFCKSFLHSMKSDPIFNSREKINLIKEKLSCLYLLEKLNWLNTQMRVGCRSCASFLDKEEVSWFPLHLEYLVNKASLPNSEFIRQYKNKKLVHSIDESSGNVMIFGSNILNLCENFLTSSETNQNEYDDLFSKQDLNDELSYEILSLALHLKERYQKFTFSPPIKQEFNIEMLTQKMREDFLSIYCQGTEFQDLYSNNLAKCEQVEETKVKSLSSKNTKKPRKSATCEPFNYYENLIDFSKKFS